MAEITSRQCRFAEVYAETLNGTRSAIAAGYAPKNAHREASRLLLNEDVRRIVATHQKRIADASFVAAVNVVRDLTDIAFADPSELVSLTRESCRHCHGFTHAFHWIDEAEFSKALTSFKREIAGLPSDIHKVAMEDAPDSVGGFGFDPRRAPHKDCPRCRGEGIERVWHADISRLEGSAKKLFAGIKETKDSVQILMRDQDKALEMLGRYFGMFSDKLKLENDKDNPIAVLIAQVQGTAIKPVTNPQENDDE